ncbi:glucosaminidase domain-containing protein [Candidatus Chlorohelix sp.]|uniref:glucosaminidase domain-containing protein n=1 Tax=Candidatus Chlorohelix sp. TaxID=3139201 RepID=UPI0030571F44
MGREATARTWDYWDEEEQDYKPRRVERKRPPTARPASIKVIYQPEPFKVAPKGSYTYEDTIHQAQPYNRQWANYEVNEMLHSTVFPQNSFYELKALMVNLYQNSPYRKAIGWVFTIGLGLFLAVIFFGWIQNATAQAPRYTTFGQSNVGQISNQNLTGTILGAPSISPEKIDSVLSSYKSPATGMGRTMYDLGIKYGINPAYALAFFIHESSAGTQGIATVTKSIGNIRVTPGYENYQGFRKYPGWDAGIEDWYKLIKNLYVDGWKLNTVEKIVPVYAPAADNNNPTAYIKHVNNLVAQWRSGN